MSFIRAKEIPPHSGNWYDYEVMTIHEGKHVRQKVIRYIGRSGTRSLSRIARSSEPNFYPKEMPVLTEQKPARITKMKTPARR